MNLLIIISSSTLVFGGAVLAWWHASLDVRVALAGLYWLISTVAFVGVELLLRLEHLRIRISGGVS
ncbi:MAG: hypothetical protein JWL65_5392 [Gammaproteobacteria bacterium]|nr:hypothetical protein [Gammaproteobacteria bacterium]